jgi:hypothetical protein
MKVLDNSYCLRTGSTLLRSAGAPVQAVTRRGLTPIPATALLAGMPRSPNAQVVQ